MRRIALLTSLFSVALLAGPAAGRFILPWDWQKLMTQADVVVVATPLETTITSDTFDFDSGNVRMEGRNTTFAVKGVLKGKPADGPLTLLHFQRKVPPKQAATRPIVFFTDHTPRTVSFVAASADGKMEAQDYLLFLKATADGRYEPVSGRMDPYWSVKEVRDTAGDDEFATTYDDAGRPVRNR